MHVHICTQSRIITSRNDRSTGEYYYKAENRNVHCLSSFSFNDYSCLSYNENKSFKNSFKN
jgi:hypothetical protein